MNENEKKDADIFEDKVFDLVDEFFADAGTAERWMKLSNPLLGGLSPNEMIDRGQGEKLFNYVKTQLEENKPKEKSEENKPNAKEKTSEVQVPVQGEEEKENSEKEKVQQERG